MPGILAETIQKRWEEFRYPSFPPFALELICFDLRRRREHLISRFFDDEPPEVREALDRELVRQYTPGHHARGLLIQTLFGEVPDTGRPVPRGSYAVYRNHVSYSEILKPCIEIRWRELGYPRFSAYVTGLIRYDLLLLGPHRYFSGDDTAPDLLAALDEETARTFYATKEPQRGYLDEMIEAAAGHALTNEECAGITRGLAERIQERVMNPRRKMGAGSAP